MMTLDHNSLQTDIVDMFAVLDIESTTKEDVKDREIFIKVLESVTKHIKHDILKERLEYETLERIKLINNSKQFNTKLVFVDMPGFSWNKCLYSILWLFY